MGIWTPPAGQGIVSDAMGMTTTGNTYGVQIVAHATPHTKAASWSEIIASTARDAYGIFINLHTTSAVNTDTSALCDIAIGGSGAEQILIPNLACGWQLEFGLARGIGTGYYFPLYIKAGSRLSARHQSIIANGNLRVAIHLIGGSRAPSGFVGHRVKDYGTDLTASRGVISTITTSNTWGTGVVLSASTDYPIRAMQVGIQGGSDNQLGGQRGLFRLQDAASPAAFYLGNPLPYHINANEWLDYGAANFILAMMSFNLPAGIPLYVAHQQNSLTNSLVSDFIIYGVD